MLIDTHCHLDFMGSAPCAAADALDPAAMAQVLARSRAAGVQAIVVPAVSPENFDRVRELAALHPDVYYALGIHPMYVDTLTDSALNALQNALTRNRHDPKLVAVGEIGLDHYVPNLDREKMEKFYVAQLRMAKSEGLPVILHVRKAQDQVLKFLRQQSITLGIAHAFNGSEQQAHAFIEQGFKLGFGGAMTFTRARQIQRLAVQLPLSGMVLETDSPDLAPAWKAKGEINEPAETAGIASHLAALRAVPLSEILSQTRDAAWAALPRLKHHMTNGTHSHVGALPTLGST